MCHCLTADLHEMSSVENQTCRLAFNDNNLSEVPDLFWKIFELNQIAIGFSDESGDFIHFNQLFYENVIGVENPNNYHAILQNLAHEDSNSQQLSIHNYRESIHLHIYKMTHPSNQYMWVLDDKKSKGRYGVASLRKLYKSFLETSFELRIKTSVSGKIIYVNTLCAQSFKFENTGKMRNLAIQQLFENENEYSALSTRLLAEHRISNETIVLKRENGSTLTGLVNCNASTDESGVTFFNWIVLDISRQAQSDLTLKLSNEKLEKVNHQMEKFLYSTSHDLRSPVATILGLISLVRLESRDHLAQSYINKIEASTLKLDKIIHDIMSFSKNTYQRSASERIDIELLVWKVINNYKDEEVCQKIQFQVHGNGSVPFFGDIDRVEIVVENIIRNSIHFCDVNKIRPIVQMNFNVTGEKVNLELIDNGVGIAKQHMPDIFKMFYKGSYLSKGAGLGLFIVKETLENIDGQISIESEVGFGTVVRIEIPNDKKA